MLERVTTLKGVCEIWSGPGRQSPAPPPRAPPDFPSAFDRSIPIEVGAALLGGVKDRLAKSREQLASGPPAPLSGATAEMLQTTTTPWNRCASRRNWAPGLRWRWQQKQQIVGVRPVGVRLGTPIIARWSAFSCLGEVEPGEALLDVGLFGRRTFDTPRAICVETYARRLGSTDRVHLGLARAV